MTGRSDRPYADDREGAPSGAPRPVRAGSGEQGPVLDRFDEIDRLLDHAGQRSTEFGYPDGTLDPAVCWRCQVAAPAPDSSAGVCSGCREILLDDTYTRPTIHDWMADRFTRIDHEGEHPPGRISTDRSALYVADDVSGHWREISGVADVRVDAFDYTLSRMRARAVQERAEMEAAYRAAMQRAVVDMVRMMAPRLREIADAMTSLARVMNLSTAEVERFTRLVRSVSTPAQPRPWKAAHSRRYRRRR